MPPREPVIFNPEINSGMDGRAGVVPVLVDDDTIISGRRPGMRSHANVLRKGDARVAAATGEIPWRTSRRLQEATFRLLQERDGGSSQSHISMEDESRKIISLPARSPKRRHCPSQPAEEANDAVQVPAEEVREDVTQVDETSSPVAELKTSIRRKRKRKEHFSGLIHPHIRDENKTVTGSSTSSNADDIPSEVSTSTKAPNVAAVRKLQPTVGSGVPHKQPQSCFDLLCSHIGLRGWRCYRCCVAGQSFCVYHQSQSTPGHDRWNRVYLT